MRPLNFYFSFFDNKFLKLLIEKYQNYTKKIFFIYISWNCFNYSLAQFDNERVGG